MREVIRSFAHDVAELPLLEPIVEIGSRPAEGQEEFSDVRSIFSRHGEFIGCDIQPGLGVDRVEDVHNLTFGDESVGTVISFDTLEHVADPIRALEEIHRVLKPGGVVAISSVMFFVIHAHPWDYWRFTPEGFARLLEPFEQRLVLAHGYELMPETVLGLAVKGPSPSLSMDQLRRSEHLAGRWAADRRVDFGPIRMSVRTLWSHTLRYTRDAGMARARRLLRRGPPREPGCD